MPQPTSVMNPAEGPRASDGHVAFCPKGPYGSQFIKLQLTRRYTDLSERVCVSMWSAGRKGEKQWFLINSFCAVEHPFSWKGRASFQKSYQICFIGKGLYSIYSIQREVYKKPSPTDLTPVNLTEDLLIKRYILKNVISIKIFLKIY